MAEYIKREDAYNAAGLIALLSVDRKITCGEVQKIMNSIPNADVVEREKGKWASHLLDDGSLWAYYCSECYHYLPYGLDWEPNFCPNCGADMREKS